MPVFLTSVYFWAGVVFGCVAMLPRITEIARRSADPTDAPPRSTFAHYMSLAVPSLMVLVFVLVLRDVTAAVTLMIVYLLFFTAVVLALKGRATSR